MTTIEDLKPNIAAFGTYHETLEECHLGEFIVFQDAKFEGAHRSFHEAAKDAVKRFGDRTDGPSVPTPRAGRSLAGSAAPADLPAGGRAAGPARLAGTFLNTRRR